MTLLSLAGGGRAQHVADRLRRTLTTACEREEPASCVGDTLRAARRGMGVSLEDAAAHTHLRETYLTALEGDDVDALGLDPAYVRGTLRTYADYLGLDATSLLARYRANGAQPAEPPGTVVKRASAPAAEVDADDQPTWHRVTRMAGGVVGLVIIAVVAFGAGEMLARRAVLPSAGGQEGQHESIREPADARAAPPALKLELVEGTWVRVTTDDQAEVSPPYAGGDARVGASVKEPAAGNARATADGEWYGPVSQVRRRSINVVCDATLRCRIDQ